MFSFLSRFAPSARKRPSTGHGGDLAHAVFAVTTAVFIMTATLIATSASPVAAASLSRGVDVDASVSDVWSAIGPFCAIKDWHPAIGSCTEDGKSPPTRTLVTKDGKATFVELRVGLSEGAHRYSYAFVSSPLPVHDYRSTIQVSARLGGRSRVVWTGQYTPEPGKGEEADHALAGIYESGLKAIKSRFEK